MKKITIIFLILGVFYSCEKSTKNDEIQSFSNKDPDFNIFDIYLKKDAEKIELISILKDVSPEKANAVLKDYLSNTFFRRSIKESGYFSNLIDTIANKNDLSKKTTASIIFSYKFEMIMNEKNFE